MGGWTIDDAGIATFETTFGKISVDKDLLDRALTFSDIGSISSESGGFHEYQTVNSLGYSMDQVSFDHASAVLFENSTLTSEWLISPSAYLDDSHNSFAGPGWIYRHQIEPGLVATITTDLHALNPGIVQRQLIVIDGTYYIQTTGFGVGIAAEMNENLADLVWGWADANLVRQLRHDLSPLEHGQLAEVATRHPDGSASLLLISIQLGDYQAAATLLALNFPEYTSRFGSGTFYPDAIVRQLAFGALPAHPREIDLVSSATDSRAPGWNDPDGHPAASGSQDLGGGKTSQDGNRSSDRHDWTPNKAPPPPLPPKDIPRETVFFNDQGQRSDDTGFIGAHPILLDLDGDGVEITELDRAATFMDASGSGLKHRTAWAGKGDGVLFWDGDNSGTINDDREYIFTEWDKTAGDDLTALRSRFDAKGDGMLSGAELASFKVMVTNADGSQTAQTVGALGITEIRLTPDTTRIQMADGSAITGQATFVQGGVSKTLAKVTLATEAEAHRVVDKRIVATDDLLLVMMWPQTAQDRHFGTQDRSHLYGN